MKLHILQANQYYNDYDSDKCSKTANGIPNSKTHEELDASKKSTVCFRKE